LDLNILSPRLLTLVLLFAAIQTTGFAQPQTLTQARQGEYTPAKDLSSVFITDCKTKGKYGLYSYFLFPRQPVFNAHTRAIEQTEQLLRKIHKLKQLYINTAANKQHTFYIPVSFEPQSWVKQPAEDDYNAAARWVVRNFDYRCAKTLLSIFPRINNAGPYILSSTRKLRQKSPWRMPVLTQDFSNIELSEANYWVDTFFKKSWQARSWGNRDLLNLRENMQALLFNYNQQQQNNAPLSNSQKITALSAKPVKIEPGISYPVNKTTTRTEINPYLDKITIQLKRNKQVKN